MPRKRAAALVASLVTSACVWMAAPAGATEVQPLLEVTTWPARIVQLVHPDGSKTCLFFQGETVYMPDGCVLAIHGSSSVNDTLNDILDDLP